MSTGNFSPAEWKQLVNAPQVIHHLLTAADRGAFFTKRSEAKALADYISTVRPQSALVQSIIAGQKDADDKIEAKPEEAQRMLEQVGALLEAKADVVEGDAVRDFLMNAGQAIAKAARDKIGLGGMVSAAEEKTLASIASALKATEADKHRRLQAAQAAQARIRAEQEAAARREAEARKQMEEARQKREAEAQKQAEQARQAREAEVLKKMEEARQKREAEAKKAEQDKALQDAEALKGKAEAMRREAESMERQAETMKAAAQGGEKEGETIYVVKPGDTLSGIAKSVYGKAGRWHEIFEANRDIIKKPNLIRPGWKLRIPK